MFSFSQTTQKKKPKNPQILGTGLLLIWLSLFLQLRMYFHDYVFYVNRFLQCKVAIQNAAQGRQLIRHKRLQFWCSLILLKYIIICFSFLMHCLLSFNWNGFCSALLQNKAASDFQVNCPEILEMWKQDIWQ